MNTTTLSKRERGAKTTEVDNSWAHGKLGRDTQLARTLSQRRSEFLRFLIQKLHNRDEAEDVLQDFCVRALEKSDQIRNRDATLPWLRAVLKSTLIDHCRQAKSRSLGYRLFASDPTNDESFANVLVDEEFDRVACLCYRSLLPGLKSEYQEAWLRVDLSDRSQTDVAGDLGISASCLRVRLHRARKALREALNRSCGGCLENGCSADQNAGEPSPTCRTYIVPCVSFNQVSTHH